MSKITIDLEGVKPVLDCSIEISQEIRWIKKIGVDAIRGINESWDEYTKRLDPVRFKIKNEELRKVRLDALKKDTRTPV